MGSKIELTKLEIVNYRNIPYQVLNFNGSSKIVGENRVGKTNTLEALYWLLTDKLLNGSSDIDQIKPLDDTKKKVSVTATFLIDDKEVTIGKEYEEQWVKTRGTEDLVFKGHTTTYIYNGIKSNTKKEFDSLFAADFGLTGRAYQGIDLIQMLINPLYLGKMGDTIDWKYLRAMIIDIVGDVTDDEVIDSNPVLSPIKEDLVRYAGRTDQILKLYRDNIKSYKEKIIGYDANIDMLSKTEKPSDESVEVAKAGIEECDANIRSLKVDSGDEQVLFNIDKEITAIRNQIIDIKRKDLEKKNSQPTEKKRKELNERKDSLHEDYSNLLIKVSNTQIEISNVERKVNDGKSAVKNMTEIRTNLLTQLQDIDEELANPTIEDECPHCHQKYPEDKVEEIIKQKVNDLMTKRVELINKGKENTQKMNSTIENVKHDQERIDDLNVELEQCKTTLKMVATQIEDVQKELDELKNDDVEVVNPEITRLEEKIKAKEDEKIEIRTSAARKEETVRSLIATEQEKKERFQKVINDLDYYERVQTQIVKVKDEKDDTSKLLIKTEQKEELIKVFIKTKLELLDSNIYKVFGDIRFMLIEPQVNGGYSTVCRPYIKGTNTLWKSGSKSEQLTTGVAICERIKQHLNLPDLPFLFDEGGEVSTDTFNTRFETTSQLICVQVRDNISTPTVMKI